MILFKNDNHNILSFWLNFRCFGLALCSIAQGNFQMSAAYTGSKK